MNRTGLNKSGLEPGNIDALLGKPKQKSSEPKAITKAIMMTEVEIEHVNFVARMIGTTNFSKGLRYCINRFWSEHADDFIKFMEERDKKGLP